MKKSILCFALTLLITSGCSLDSPNICGGICQCFTDNDGSKNLDLCAKYIPENAAAYDCDANNQCMWRCEPGFSKSKSGDACVGDAGGCDSSADSVPVCQGNNLRECTQNNQWHDIYTCTDSCVDNQCTSTCSEAEVGTHRCLENGKYQVCEANDYERIWKDSDACTLGCSTETNECNEKPECKGGYADDGVSCAPWMESSENPIVIDAGLDKTIKLTYFDPSDSSDSGINLDFYVKGDNCIDLSKDKDILLADNPVTELTIQPKGTICSANLIVSSAGIKPLTIPVTVREPVDDNHNHMYDVLETATKLYKSCRTDADCEGDVPGFCDSASGFTCASPCTQHSDCIGDQFYCRQDNRCAAKAFETIWEIPDDDSKHSITIPTQNASECNFDIDWGDGKNEHVSSCPDSGLEHTYTKPGTYHVRITGTYKDFAFSKNKNIKTNPACDRFKGVVSWGPVGLGGKGYYVFFKCQNNDYAEAALDIPDSTQLTNMAYMFTDNPVFNQPIGNWDTSNVTNMSHLFDGASVFNQSIGNWHTSNVTTLNYAFRNAMAFNQDLDGWDTSNVTSMESAFASASSFNGKIGEWNISNVTNMKHLFDGATVFNQPIGNWNTSNVTSLGYVFRKAAAFNQDLDGWDTSNVTDMGCAFESATSFNGKIGSWDVSKVMNMEYLFSGASAFDQPIGSWNTSNVQEMDYAFNKAAAFNQDLDGWNISKVTSLYNTFAGAENFNGKIGSWDVSNVTDMSHLFEGASAFNQPIENWNISKVTTLNYTFHNAAAFNQDLDGWDTSNVRTMEYTFDSASSFNGKVGNWDTSNVNNMTNMFHNASSFNQPIDWNVAKVGTMTAMFSGAASFNSSIHLANIPKCSLNNMFENATMFNDPSINDWDVSKGTNFKNMFANAKAFNQPLADWKVNATSIDGMFMGAENFNQNISAWNPSKTKNISQLFDGATKYNQPLKWTLNTLKEGTNVVDMFRGTSLSKENFCESITDSGLSEFAAYLGVSFSASDCN